MSLGLLPATVSAASSITPGGATVSGTLTPDSGSAEYTLPAMNAADSWGVEFTVNVNGAPDYEIWLTLYSGDYDGYTGDFETETEDFYATSTNDYETKTASGFTYKSPVISHAADSYKYEVSIPEYMWADLPSSVKISYSLKLYKETATDTPTPSVSGFSDVKSGDWFYDAVVWGVDKGLFQGTGGAKFSPNDSLNRAQFVTILSRRANIDPSDYAMANDFDDVDYNAWYGSPVTWAYEIGVTSGTGTRQFSPMTNISRQDLVTMLYRYVGLVGGDTNLNNSNALRSFTDRGDVALYARDAFTWAIDKGIISGTGNSKLSPTATATRAQAAKIFMTADEYLSYKAPVDVDAQYEQSVQTVDEDIDAKLDELLDGTTVVPCEDVMSAMYDMALGWEEDGVVSNVTSEDSAIHFDYPDGTPGGIFMNTPTEWGADTAQASALSAPSLGAASVPAQTALSLNKTAMLGRNPAQAVKLAATSTAAATDNPNVVGNNKVLWAFDRYYYYKPMFSNDLVSDPVYDNIESMLRNNTRGLSITEATTNVELMKTLGDYGVVLLTFPGIVNRGAGTVILMAEKLGVAPASKYKADRHDGAVALYSVLTPSDQKGASPKDSTLLGSDTYAHVQSFGIVAERFFSLYYPNADSLPNSFIHFGTTVFRRGTLANILFNAGAGVVSGYTDDFRTRQELDALNAMVFVMLRDTENTAEDAEAAIVDKDLKYDSFKAIDVTKDFKIKTMDINTELDIRWQTDISDESQSGNYLRWWAEQKQTPPPTSNYPQITKAWIAFGSYSYTTNNWQMSLRLNTNSDKRLFYVTFRYDLTAVPTTGNKAGQEVKISVTKEDVNGFNGESSPGGSAGYIIVDNELTTCQIKDATVTLISYSYYTDEYGGEITTVKIPESEQIPVHATDDVY
jgi:hypothetical protein